MAIDTDLPTIAELQGTARPRGPKGCVAPSDTEMGRIAELVGLRIPAAYAVPATSVTERVQLRMGELDAAKGRIKELEKSLERIHRNLRPLSCALNDHQGLALYIEAMMRGIAIATPDE